MVRNGSCPQVWSAPPGKWRWRRRSSGDFCYLMRGRRFVPPALRRGTTQRPRRRRSASLNFFADVTCVRPGGRCRRGINNGDPAETATPLNYFAGVRLSCSRITNAAEHITEAALLKRHSVGLFRACLRPPPPGGQFRQTHNRGGPANAGARSISPPSLVSPPRGGSVLAGRKQRSGCPDGLVGQLCRHH